MLVHEHVADRARTAHAKKIALRTKFCPSADRLRNRAVQRTVLSPMIGINTLTKVNAPATAPNSQRGHTVPEGASVVVNVAVVSPVVVVFVQNG